MTFNENGVSRHPVALGKHDEVAAHDIAAGNPLAFAVADDQRTRAGQVAEGFEDPLGASLLDDGDQDGEGCEDDQNDRLLYVAECEIDAAATQQQRQHRLAQDFQHDTERGPPLRARKLVEPLDLQSRLGVGLGQPQDQGGTVNVVDHER